MSPAKFKPVNEQLTLLSKGAAEIIRDEDLRAKLENSCKTGKPLRVKLGVDPTAPDLHLGHTVVLRKLRHFQEMGHTAIFLVGDFTAMVGDPTGQSETRPPLTREQVSANMKTYLEQVDKILDRSKTEVRYNSQWLGKLTGHEMLQLCAHYRLARMLEREDFRSRLANNLPISVHELLYPLLVAYDSVVLEADVELGATEQKFNLLIGRDIQREYGQPSQVALTMPILVGLDGERKMSKSFGNYVGINEPPGEMFGKLMSISDSLMWSYYELLTDLSSRDLVRLQGEVKDGVVHPMDAKMQLAHIIIAGFQGEAAARKAAVEFRRVFRNREAPEHPIECRIGGVVGGLAMIKIMRGDIVDVHNWPVGSKGKVRLSALLVPLADISSRSEGERLIKQGGVEIDSQRVDDVKREIDLSRPGEFLLRAGKKKFLRIIVE